ncbi:MAG: endonuclease/exonuclease/phosphatase family protein [Opitutaceae bacterium]
MSFIRPLVLVAASVFAFASLALPARAQTSESAMRLMTFNVRLATPSDGANAWEHRKEFARDVVEEFDPHILGVQEALQTQLDFLTAELPHRASIGEARGGGGKDEYSAIIYDTQRLQALDSDTFWLSDTPGEPSMSWGNRYLRICTWARFRDRDSGACFHVFNTHLDHESENARLRGIELILQRIREREHAEPFFLMGDFNAGEAGEPVRLITSQAQEHGARALPTLVDTFRVRHPDETRVGTCHAFTGTDDGRKIDSIFAPAGIEVLSAEIIREKRDGRHPSDHFPVTAVVRLP